MSAARGYPSPGMLGPRAIAWWSLRTMTERVDVEGLEHVPAAGPVLLAARHYHHLLDGAVLVRHLRRPVHVVVALDWARSAGVRRWMERACALARWPVILRPATTADGSAYAAREVGGYLRSGLREAAALLRDGRVVVMFPEGYPVVDPAPARPGHDRDADGFLPFGGGLTAIARLARRAGAGEVPIVPVGFRYERPGPKWRIAARFGAALPAGADTGEVERMVRALSGAELSRSAGR